MNSIIDKLIEIDNLRENYYKDLRKCHLNVAPAPD